MQRTTTVKELGPVLPIGLSDTAQLKKMPFSCKPFMCEDEMRLAELKRENAAVSKLMGKMLALLIDDIWEKEDDTEQKKVAKLTNLYFADFMYLYLYLRKIAIDSKYTFYPFCPHCKENDSFTIDIDDIEVVTAEEPTDLTWETTLRDGIRARGKVFKKVELTIPKWGAFINARTKNMNELQQVLMMHSASIIKGDGDPLVFSAEELRKGMSKYDNELLKTNYKNFGPDLSIDLQCRACGRLTKIGWDWGYDVFFTVSQDV